MDARKPKIIKLGVRHLRPHSQTRTSSGFGMRLPFKNSESNLHEGWKESSERLESLYPIKDIIPVETVDNRVLYIMALFQH